MVGEFTTHFRTYYSGWIGMFTAGTIWLLTHAHVNPFGRTSREVTPARCVWSLDSDSPGSELKVEEEWLDGSDGFSESKGFQ